MFLNKPKSAAAHRQAGFTFFEILGVIAVIGLAMVAAMKVKHGLDVRSSVNTLNNNVGFVMQKTPDLYPTNFAGLTCTVMANNGAFTGTSFRIDRTVPATPVVFYGNEANSQIACASANLFGTNDAYTLTFSALTNDMCNELADKLADKAWVMSVNGTQVKPARGLLDPATKGAACNSTSTSDNQVVAVTLARTLPPQ